MADSLVSRFGCYTIIWDTTGRSGDKENPVNGRPPPLDGSVDAARPAENRAVLRGGPGADERPEQR